MVRAFSRRFAQRNADQELAANERETREFRKHKKQEEIRVIREIRGLVFAAPCFGLGCSLRLRSGFFIHDFAAQGLLRRGFARRNFRP
jgi:hypothetical protein